MVALWTLFIAFVSQSHTYVNLTDLDLTAGSVSRSELASVSNGSSLSQSKADSLSSQMARLSKYSSLLTLILPTASVLFK